MSSIQNLSTKLATILKLCIEESLLKNMDKILTDNRDKFTNDEWANINDENLMIIDTSLDILLNRK